MKIININNIPCLIWLLLLSMTFTLISACGGGGEQSAGAQTPAATLTTSVPVPVIQPSEQVLTITDLVIDPAHNLASVYKLHLAVDISSNSKGRAYISICENNDPQVDITAINYQDCLLGSPLAQGKLAVELTLANHVQELIAVIWFTDITQSPVINQWRYAKISPANWQIN